MSTKKVILDKKIVEGENRMCSAMPWRFETPSKYYLSKTNPCNTNARNYSSKGSNATTFDCPCKKEYE